MSQWLRSQLDTRKVARSIVAGCILAGASINRKSTMGRRNGGGAPILRSRACGVCGEWRCPTHCRCGRKRNWKPRRARRTTSAADRETLSRTPLITAAAPLAVDVERESTRATKGRPTELCAIDVFTTVTWRRSAVEDIAAASHVVLCMYLYDASDFHRAIMSALRRNSDFMCVW